MPNTTVDSTKTLPGDSERTFPALAPLMLGEKNTPPLFPISIWNAQQARYDDYWKWYRGDYLAQVLGKDENGDNVYKFPLHINTVRNFARKHVAVLFGEVPDGTSPMVQTVVTPKQPLDGSSFSDEDRKLASVAQNVLNEVWSASAGRAIQLEAGTMSQILGGCYFQVRFEKNRPDLLIPITIKYWDANFILPIWKGTEYWDLEEVYLVYRISGTEAAGYSDILSPLTGFGAAYIEHWTKDWYSIYVNNVPAVIDGVKQIEIENPFGFVPFTYIPHLREGNFFGPSIVDDIRGLVEEYNARFADFGDAIHDTIDRKRWMTNVNIATVKEKTVGKGVEVIDLGSENPSAKNPPNVKVEDPPQLSQALTDFPGDIWNQLLRDGSVSSTAFGEDEGSQRSALTLAFRMFPSTSHARSERTFWDVGLGKVATQIFTILAIKKINIGKYLFTSQFLLNFLFSSDWFPQIPRDREQLVNEIVLRKQTNLASTKFALQQLGDVRNVDEEIENIHEDMEFMAELQMKQQPQQAQLDIQTPVASTGVSERD